jgi:anti-sigma factor RsiW
MRLSKETMLELMAYADGEIDENERIEEIEKLIASDADAKRVVESMGVLGRVVQRIYEPPAASSTDGLVDEIMASVAKEGVPRKPSVRPPKVVDLRDLRERRLKVAGAIVAVVALAAGIVLTTHRANQSPFQAFQTPPPGVTAPAPAPAPAPVAPPCSATPPAPCTANGGKTPGRKSHQLSASFMFPKAFP